jgi:hypothetical protein
MLIESKLEKVYSLRKYKNKIINYGLLHGIIFDKKIKLINSEYIYISKNRDYITSTTFRQAKYLIVSQINSLYLSLRLISKYFIKKEKDKTIFDGFEKIIINLDSNGEKLLKKFGFKNLKHIILVGSGFCPLNYLSKFKNLNKVTLQDTTSEFFRHFGKSFRKIYNWDVELRNSDTGDYC